MMTLGKITYWASTALLCLIYAGGAAMYLAQKPMVEEGFVYLGYPAYLVTLLIAVKIAGALAILTRVSVRLSDLAYAGMFYHLILAFAAQLSIGGMGFVSALAGMAVLVTSFLSQNQARKKPSPNVPARFGIAA